MRELDDLVLVRVVKVFYYNQPRTREELQRNAAMAQAAREATLKRARNDEDRAARHRAEALRARRKAQREANRGKPFFQRLRGYFAAETNHAVAGPAPAAVVEERVRTCMACPKRADELDGLKDDGGVGFCLGCGCPASRRSQLSVKLTVANVPCPLGKFPAVQGTGGSARSAFDAVRGVAQTLAGTLRRVIR